MAFSPFEVRNSRHQRVFNSLLSCQYFEEDIPGPRICSWETIWIFHGQVWGKKQTQTKQASLIPQNTSKALHTSKKKKKP